MIKLKILLLNFQLQKLFIVLLGIKKENFYNERIISIYMFKFILKIFLIFTLILAVIFIYFYQFHTFEIMPRCISNTNIEELNLPCSTNEECLDKFMANKETVQQLKNMPDIAKTQLQDTFKKAIFCQQTCKMKNMYESDSCLQGEEMVSIQFKGKDALQLLKVLMDSKK